MIHFVIARVFRFQRSFLLAIFAMLQCVAPLLHAHPGETGHGGMHLPKWSSPTCQDTQAAWQVVDQAADPALLTLDLSAGVRFPAHPARYETPLRRFAEPEDVQRTIFLAHERDDLPPRLTSWRTPFPSAPPRA